MVRLRSRKSLDELPIAVICKPPQTEKECIFGITIVKVIMTPDPVLASVGELY